MSKMTATQVFKEKLALINKISASIDTVDNIIPQVVESISVYGNRYAITLTGEDEIKRSFTFRLLAELNIKKLKRDLSNPSQLEYNFELSSTERWSDTRQVFEFNIVDYPCNFRTECEKTCYAVYEDGRRIPIVKKDKIEADSFDADVVSLQNEEDGEREMTQDERNARYYE